MGLGDYPLVHSSAKETFKTNVRKGILERLEHSDRVLDTTETPESNWEDWKDKGVQRDKIKELNEVTRNYLADVITGEAVLKWITALREGCKTQIGDPAAIARASYDSAADQVKEGVEVYFV